MNAQTPFDPAADFDPALDPYHANDDEIDRAAGGFRSEVATQINRGLEANPDDAAEAMDLSKFTGVPPAWTMQNLDDQQAQAKRFTAQQLVLNNPDLVAYAQSHPMAASVSNDDWANLDEASGINRNLAALHKLLNAPFEKIGQAEVEGMQAGWQGVDLSSEYAKYADPQTDPLGTFGALATIGTAGTANLLLRTMGALFGAGIGGVVEAGREVGGERLAKGVGELSEWALQRGDVALHAGEAPEKVPNALLDPAKHEGFMQMSPLAQALEKAGPWWQAGLEPPIGLHPEIDKGKATLNAEAVKLLDQALQSVQSSTTHERSVELMKGFLDQYHQDARLTVSADAALNLYGDKPPAPGDGLLGWVPDIDTQLAGARDLVQGVSVKMSDYLANIDPEVHKAIRDDLLMYPGGITAREAKELPPAEPKAVVDAPLAQVRDAAGLEPKFAMGDRKLELSLREKLPATDFVGTELPEAHNYDMLDENGQPVGDMQIIPGKNKELYVNWMGGNTGMFSNSFGPSLIRDLKRQLKAFYPDYDTLTGYRVSGAREMAGANALAKVKLMEDTSPSGWGSIEGDHQKMTDIFQNGWQRWNERVQVNAQQEGFYTPEQHAEGQAAQEELQRIAPGVDVQGVAGIRRTGTNRVAAGMYSAYADRPPTILHDLLGPDQVGVLRHEGMHYLRDYGFFRPAEWSALESAAKSEGWLDRYDIHERYAGLDDEGKLEEGVVEAFREWARQAPEVRPKTGVGAVFQKLWDFLDRIRQRMGEALGRTPTWEEVFQRTHEGEVGRRGPGEPAREGAFDLRERYAIEGDDNLRAQAVGLPVDSFRKAQDSMRARNEADLEAAIARNKKIQERNQSKEWRSNRADMAKEVAAEIRQRPDVAADAFVGSGELGGQKLQQRFTLRTDDFTPEQRAEMPEHYTSKNGLPADQVAGMFGMGSKDELAAALAGIHTLRTTAEGDRMGRRDFLSHLVQSETDRRMEARYGDRDANVMDAAMDHALSQTSINVMDQELLAQALKAGVTAFDKNLVEATAKQRISEMALGKVSSYRLHQDMGRFGRAALKAKIDGDDVGMFRAMQRQTIAAYAAKEARAVEKRMKTADKQFRTLSKRELPSMDNGYLDRIHGIMQQIGKPIKRSPADLAQEIQASGGQSLQDWENNATSHAQVFNIWDQLYDPKWNKAYKDLTVDEFDKVYGSIQDIAHNGRAEKKGIRSGDEADLKVITTEAVANLQQFPASPLTMAGEKHPPGVLKHTWARLLTVETILNRWDGFDWKGVWQQSFFRPLVEGANQAAAWEKEMAKVFKDIVNRPAASDKVSNTIFRIPDNGQLGDMTREQLRGVMLYMGSESGFDKLVRGYSSKKFGYDLTREQVMDWVHSVMTKEDLDFVNGIWASMEKPRGWSDEMYRRQSGRPMQGIEPVPYDTPHGRATGGYVPIRYHPYFEGSSQKLSGISMKGLFGSGYSTGFAPDATYKIERTKYAAPLDLTLDALVPAVKQQIRDAALRPALANGSKILRDGDVAAAIKSRYGSEYHEMLKEYLRRLAGTENRGGPQGQYTKLASQTLEFARQNLIATLVGFNPGTVMKHGMTAFVLSAREVGPVNMRRAMKQLYTTNDETGQTWRQFAYENSQELQRRDRNWQENLYGSTTSDEAKGWAQNARQQFMYWGSKPVALADALSSEPTWLAAYMKERDAGGSHGDGIYAGDRAVRRAHGSTSAAAQPMIMSHLTPWVTSLYNFFNDVLNRAVETTWRAGEMVGTRGRPTNWSLASGVAAGMFATVIWPAIVENLVSPLPTEPGESTTKRVLKGSIHSTAAMIPVVRDFAEYLSGGDSPDVGLLTTEQKALGEAWKDLWKKQPFNNAHAEKLIRDFGTTVGALTGAPGMQIGREAGFAYGLATGAEHPRGPWGWLVGGRYGTTKGHSQTLQDYMAGRSSPNR